MQFSCYFDISAFRSCYRAPGKGVRCAIRTCRRMFRKGSPNPARLTFETVLGSQTPKIHAKSSTEPQEGPEWHRRAWMEHQIVPKFSLEDSQKTRNGNSIFSRETSPRKENVNKHMGRHQIAEYIFRTLHVPHQSASKRTMAPQTAPRCPEAPPNVAKNH